jgi:hypothetical protein
LIAARLYDIPYSQRRSLSVDTLLNWALRDRRDGLAALAPKPRQDRGQMRVIPPETAPLIERLKRENPHRTGVALLRDWRSPTSPIRRACRPPRCVAVCAPEASPNAKPLLDQASARKKYEAEFANQIWQSDMLFGPWVQRPGGGERQVFLQAILDDASRLIPHAQFYPDRGLGLFLDSSLGPKITRRERQRAAGDARAARARPNLEDSGANLRHGCDQE